MSSDYADKEREFIDTLEADTGRDLAGWMAAIAGAGLGHRNDIIDWLRRQRFTFDRASWLERIHHNGGRPIYAEKPDPRSKPEVKAEAPAFDQPPPAEVPRPAPKVLPRPSAVPATAAAAAAQSDLETLLARGKAFRPLAQHLLKSIDTAHPGTSVTARGNLIALAATAEFAVIALSGKDLKLGLALDDAAPRDGLDTARIPGAGPAITHMVTLTDVRRIDTALLVRIAEAAALASRRPA